jgi:hypothetical protein
MSKGGFVSALLAQRNSSSAYGFAWRSLYYVWLGIPLLILYYVVFWYVFNTLVSPIEQAIFSAFGLQQAFVEALISRSRKFQEAMMAGSKGDITKASSDLITYILGAFTGVLLFDSLFKVAVMTALYQFGILDILLAPVFYITKV